MATRGQDFKTAVLEQFELRPDELEVLNEISATLDVLDRLPADEYAEARQNRMVLARLMGLLSLRDDPIAKPSMSGKSIRARAAAEARWRRTAQA